MRIFRLDAKDVHAEPADEEFDIEGKREKKDKFLKEPSRWIMADLTRVSVGRLRLAATLATSVLVFVLIYLAVWAEPEREDADGFVVCLEPRFTQFAYQGKWSNTVFWIALTASLVASMICYLATWGITSRVDDATVSIVVGIMFLSGIITIMAVGAASLTVHCFLVNFVLIN